MADSTRFARPIIFAFAGLLVAAPSFAEVLLLSQTRTVEASGSATDSMTMDDDSAADASPGFDPFSSGVEVDVAVDGAAAYANAVQQSGIGPTSATVLGTVALRGESIDPTGVGIAQSTSHCEYSFEVVTPQEYRLVGLITASGGGATFVELSGPSGVIERFDSPTNGNQTVGGLGILLAGVYTFTVETSGSAVGEEEMQSGAAGLYEIALAFEDADPADVVASGERVIGPIEVAPQPASRMAELAFGSPLVSGERVAIFAASGRLVRSWSPAPGTSHIVWDLVGTDGRPVPSGIYFARAFSGERVREAKLVVTR